MSAVLSGAITAWGSGHQRPALTAELLVPVILGALMAAVFNAASNAINGLFLLGASTTKDFADIEGDRKDGCTTLPILYGVRKAAWITATEKHISWKRMYLMMMVAQVGFALAYVF